MTDFYDDEGPNGPDFKKKPSKQVKRPAAVAIRHILSDENPTLPKVTAAGYGRIAEEIVRIAFDNGVKVREDGDLAQFLAQIELESEIPSEALVAVAEILSYVYRANGTYIQKEQRQDDLNE